MRFRKVLILLSLIVGGSLLTLSPAVLNNDSQEANTKTVLKREKNEIITYSDSDTSLSIIVIVAVVGITITGAYIYLMKGNDKK